MTNQYPKFVPFDQRQEAFNVLKEKVRVSMPDHSLCISDVRYDRYGIYRFGCRKAVVLINGLDLGSFDLLSVTK